MTDTATILDPQHAPNGDKLKELSSAGQIASSWEVTTRPHNAGNFQQRVQTARIAIQELEAQLTSLPASASPDDLRMIALLDLREIRAFCVLPSRRSQESRRTWLSCRA